MSISVQCPTCGAKLKAPDALAGKKAKCKCGTVVSVPGGAPKPQPAKAASPSKPGADAPTRITPPPAQPAAPPAPRWRPMTARVCPSCQAKMEPDTVLCTECGFHTVKGIKIPMAAAAAAKAKSPGAIEVETEQKPAAPLPGGGVGGVIGELIRPVMILLVLVGVAFGVYSVIEWIKHDPVAEGKAKVAKLGRGMTVDQVVAIMGEPKEVYTYRPEGGGGGGLLGSMGRVARIGYAPNFMQAHGKEKLKMGFYFAYHFSAAAEHQVHFDADGKVEGVEEVPNLFRR